MADVIAEANRNLGIREPYTSGTQIMAAYREMNRLIDRWAAESWARTFYPAAPDPQFEAAYALSVKSIKARLGA